MCVWLKSDFIVSLVIKDNCDLYDNNETIDNLTIGIEECLEKQEYCKKSGYGNVVAKSQYGDFLNYLDSNRRYFERIADGIYSVRLNNLRKNTEDNALDYELLFNMGKYSIGTLEDFGIPL